MSVLTIIGLVLWGLTLLFGGVKINDVEPGNLFMRIIVRFFAFPIVGIVLVLIGLIGMIMITPLLHFFNIDINNLIPTKF